MESAWTPRSSHAWSTRLIARTPWRWPKLAGRPRPRAQRPLPSMMIPTWRGTGESKGEESVPIAAVFSRAPLPWGRGKSSPLDFHDFGFFAAGQGVDLLDLRFGDL